MYHFIQYDLTRGGDQSKVGPSKVFDGFRKIIEYYQWLKKTPKNLYFEIKFCIY